MYVVLPYNYGYKSISIWQLILFQHNYKKKNYSFYFLIQRTEIDIDVPTFVKIEQSNYQKTVHFGISFYFIGKLNEVKKDTTPLTES